MFGISCVCTFCCTRYFAAAHLVWTLEVLSYIYAMQHVSSRLWRSSAVSMPCSTCLLDSGGPQLYLCHAAHVVWTLEVLSCIYAMQHMSSGLWRSAAVSLPCSTPEARIIGVIRLPNNI